MSAFDVSISQRNAAIEAAILQVACNCPALLEASVKFVLAMYDLPCDNAGANLYWIKRCEETIIKRRGA